MLQEAENKQESDILQQAVGLVKEKQRLAREREKAEEEIKSLAKFCMENPNPVLRIEENGELLFSNPPAQVLLNDGTIKTGDRVPPEFHKLVSLAHSTQSIQKSEITIGTQTFYLQWVPILNEGYVNVYGRDITKRKKAEAKLQAQTKQQTVVTELGYIALTGIDLSKLMDQAVHLLSQVLKVEYVKILKFIPEEHAFLMQAGCGWKEGLVGKAMVPDEMGSQAGYTLRSNGPVVVKDLNRETRFSGPQLLLDHEVISGMSVIILSGNRPFGVLGIHTKQKRIFTSDEINFLQSVANVLSNAIKRKKVEQALRVSETRAKEVLEYAACGIITIDEQGIIESFNPAAEDLFGYKPSEVLGTNIKFLMPEPFQSEHDRYLKKYLEAGISKIIGIRREAVGLRKDGSTFPLDLGISEMYLGETRKFTGIVRDISELKQAEAEKQMQYELTRIFLDGQSLENTFPRILQAIGEFMEWEIGYYWEKKPESDELDCRYAWNAPCLNESAAFKEFKENSFTRTFEKGTGLPGRVWDQLEPSWIADVIVDANFPRAPFAEKLGMKSGFGFPVYFKRQFMGVVEIFTRQVCQPDTPLTQMMANLGGQIGQWMRLKKAEEHLDKLNLKTFD